MNNNKIQTANLFRNIARYGLLIIGITVFVFALLSGAETYGGGLMGVFQNSPNALPWLTLLLMLGFAWKMELVGGILITAFGLYLMYYFNFGTPNFFWFTFVLTLGITVLGALFLVSWGLRKGAV